MTFRPSARLGVESTKRHSSLASGLPTGDHGQAAETTSSGPDIAVAGVDPRRPSHLVVGKRAHDGGVAVGGQRNRATLSGGYLYLLGRFSIPMWSLPFQVERELHLFQPRQMKKFNYIT